MSVQNDYQKKARRVILKKCAKMAFDNIMNQPRDYPYQMYDESDADFAKRWEKYKKKRNILERNIFNSKE